MEYKPSVGAKFRPTKVAEECNGNPILQSLLNSIRLESSKNSFLDKIKAIAEKLSKDFFFEKIDYDQENYLILDSFQYLEKVITLIHSIEHEKISQ